MTTKTPLNPIVVRFNPLTTSYQVIPQRQYFYSVIVYSAQNYYRVFTGKTYSHYYPLDSNYGEVDMEISNILKPYMYESEYSIKPEFDVNDGTFHPYWNSNQEEVSTIDGNDPRTYGFGVMRYFVYLFENSNQMSNLNAAVAVHEGELTSSWDISSPAYYRWDDFLWQNLLELEFPKGFVSHYPKISTTNFGVFGLVNISDAYYSRYIEDRPSGVPLTPDIPVIPIYIGNQVYHFENLTKVYDAIELQIVGGNGSGYAGYLPFNITLYDILNSLREVTETPIVFENIVGADSDDPIENTFTTGTSQQYSAYNTWIGGTARPHETARQGYNMTDGIFIMTPDFTWGHDNVASTGEKIQIGTLDTCPAKYYLVWMTKSCTPVCYGFDGNTIFSQDFESTYMTSKYGNDVLKMQTVANKWELKSGVIDKNTYSVMEDIYTSPYILLYEVSSDKCTYVKCTDTSFTRKNSVVEDKQPFYFNVNLEEVHKKELYH